MRGLVFLLISLCVVATLARPNLKKRGHTLQDIVKNELNRQKRQITRGNLVKDGTESAAQNDFLPTSEAVVSPPETEIKPTSDPSSSSATDVPFHLPQDFNGEPLHAVEKSPSKVSPFGRMPGPMGGMRGPIRGMRGPMGGMPGPMSRPMGGMPGQMGVMPGQMGGMQMGGMQGPMGGMPMGGMQGPMGGMQGPMGGMQGPMGGMQGPMGGMQGPMGGMPGPMGGMPGPMSGMPGPMRAMPMPADFQRPSGAWVDQSKMMAPQQRGDMGKIQEAQKKFMEKIIAIKTGTNGTANMTDEEKKQFLMSDGMPPMTPIQSAVGHESEMVQNMIEYEKQLAEAQHSVLKQFYTDVLTSRVVNTMFKKRLGDELQTLKALNKEVEKARKSMAGMPQELGVVPQPMMGGGPQGIVMDPRAVMMSQAAMMGQMDPRAAMMGQMDPRASMMGQIDPRAAMMGQMDPRAAMMGQMNPRASMMGQMDPRAAMMGQMDPRAAMIGQMDPRAAMMGQMDPRASMMGQMDPRAAMMGQMDPRASMMGQMDPRAAMMGQMDPRAAMIGQMDPRAAMMGQMDPRASMMGQMDPRAAMMGQMNPRAAMMNQGSSMADPRVAMQMQRRQMMMARHRAMMAQGKTTPGSAFVSGLRQTMQKKK